MPNLRGKTWTTSTPANVEDAQYWEDHLISDAQNAKILSSVQSVNSVTPDANGNVDVVALPDGGTTGQVLMKVSNTSGDADWEDLPQSGHTIQNPSGTAMTDRTVLQFLNADVSDDAVNGKTVVDCQGEKGDAATVTVGTTTTLPAGSSATVTNSGTTSAAVFDFGIPKGADGTDGEDGADGVSPAVTISTITGGHRVQITDKDHPSGQSFDVMDGVTQDISGKQDKTLSAQVESQSTVEGALGALSTNKVDWSSAGKSVKKNLYDINNATTNGTGTLIKNDDVWEISTTTADTGIYVSGGDMLAYLGDYANEDLIYSCDFKTDSNSTVKIFDTEVIASTTEWQHREVLVPSNASSHGFRFYNEESGEHTLYIKNVMFRLATIADSTFAPFIYDNAELDAKKAEISAIGDDESGRATASRTYSAGEYFYKDGQNCRTKSAVLSGATWTLNTNYEAASIDEAISIYEGTITPSTGITLHARTKVIKQGKIVSLNALFQGVSCNAETDFNLGNIASEYRPTYVVNGVGLASDGSAMARIQISGNGNIILYSASAISNKSIGLNLSYVLI